MFKLSLFLAIVISPICLIPAVCRVFPAEIGSAIENCGNIEKLSSKNPQERVLTKNQLIQDRQQLIKSLMAMVQKRTQYELYDQTTLAIELLGNMRAKEAVDILAENITLQPPLVNFEVPRKEETFVAAVALVQIGNPAIPAMVRNITTSSDQVKREISTWVIQEILGTDLARASLTQTLANTEDQTSQERIKAALLYIESSGKTKR
jgi:hypothetical protein